METYIMPKSENQNSKSDVVSYVPDVDKRYYTYGNFNKVKDIIDSKKFYPIWITGLAGNGKTQMVEQACAATDREFIRVNFTMETDENDLIGHQTLDYKVNADNSKEEIGSVFHEGPVVEALRRGAVLLLDEIDVGHTNKIMCLQPVLEGKGVLIKSTGEFVKPAPGFQIFATSNTKGKGSEDGKFIGTNIMNGAFLDRFSGTIEQTYPPKKIEENILKRYFINYHWADRASETDVTKDELNQAAVLCAKLCEWASSIRDAYDNGAVDEVITTRSLINIIQGYSIFGNPMQAIELSCSRFDEATKESFIDFYKKLNDTEDYVNKDDKPKVEDDGEYVKYGTS